MVDPARVAEPKAFERYADRIYFEDVANAESARLAFIAAPGEQREQLDPLAELASGCFLSFPPTPDLDALLTQALIEIAAKPKLRLLVVSSRGIWRSGIEVNPNGKVSSGEIQFGDTEPDGDEPPTGDGKWRLKLETTILSILPGHGLQFDFGRNAHLAGFYSDFHARAPRDAEWARFEVYGSRAGLWTVPVVLDQAKLAGLGVGTAFFEKTGAISYDKRTYPLFDLEQDEERFSLELNCADPYCLGEARTSLILPEKPLRAALNDANGRKIAIVSDPTLANGGRIVLTPAPATVEEGKITSLTHQLVPEGTFTVAGAAPADKALSISLGASNLETLVVPAKEGGATIRFAHGPALVVNGPSEKIFDDDPTFATAWIEVDASHLETQPLAIDAEGMQPYAFVGDKSATDGEMEFRPTRPSLRSKRIPFAPVLGLTSGANELTYERDVLSKARRARLVGKRPAALKSDGDEELRTPQGYFAKRGGEGFDQIVFTRTQPRQPDARRLRDGTEAPNFGLLPTTDEGRQALAEITTNSRLFLATRLDKLLAHFDADSLAHIYMADWRVDRVPEATQAAPSNFVILKHDERSVEELLERPDQWLHITGLELDASERKVLKEEVDGAIAAAPTNDLFKPLARRLQSTKWCGLVCFGMELGEMPDQLGALETLVDALPVHHVGVDLTAIETDAAQPWRASIFGLINKYEPSAFCPENPARAPMQLQLADLKLLVENDAVKHFSCKVNARVGTIFGTKLDKTPEDNPFTLEGLYQSRVNPKGERQDSYSFVIARVNGQDPLFSFSPATFVLEEVAFSRAELVTIVEHDSEGKRRKNGMLLLDGWLKFGEIGEAQLFAIDRLDFAALGVKFGKLSTDFDFDLRFEFPSLRFDFAKFNRLREVKNGSFLDKLPFRLSGFRIGDFSLGKLDYFDFGSLGDDLPSLDAFKLALDFDLDLGSLGSLGKKLEHFKLNFLIGWDPDILNKLASGFRIDTGDGGGALDLGIEGIIKLTAKHFHIGKSEDGSGRYVLALDEARLKLFSVELPKGKEQRFSLYLLGDPKSDDFTDKIAWYGVFNDEDGTDGPVSINHLALGQRIEITRDGKPISGIRTTSKVLDTIKDLHSFDEPDADQKFLTFAKSHLQHQPQRGWFVALQGSFFEVFDLQLLLRDPDMYGIYVKLLADDLAIDLLYQKLADGVGLYSGELDLRKLVGQIDFGAVSVTLGIIRCEVYTDGGFLIDLGFPEHVDYSRSFVAQAGIFIGKGGFYIGRTPGQAIPAFAGMEEVGNAFRMGLALRLGLGREFEKGPLYASLSVSVFGRIEGAVAEAKRLTLVGEAAETTALATRADALMGGSYIFFLQGEIGIILEIEGRVDLRLVQARVLVRAWIAAGITLVTGKPIIVHAEAGVKVKVRVVIGKIRIFRKTIKIYVTLSYSTTLRYEWELKGGPRMKLALASWTWMPPEDSGVAFANVPVRLRLSLEITRAGPRQAVMVPMTTTAVVDDSAANPLAALAQGLILWALAPSESDPLFQRFTTGDGEPTIAVLTSRLKTLSSQPDAWIDSFLSSVLHGSTVELAATDEDDDTALVADEHAWSFPLPPGLTFGLAGKVHDLSQLPDISERDVDMMADEIAAQFALQSPTLQKSLDDGAARPLVAHIFRNWMETLALNTLDAMQNAWPKDPEGPEYAEIRMSQLIEALDANAWDGIAGRTGRYLFGGIRVSSAQDPKTTVPLFGRAEILFPIPKADFELELEERDLGWLRQVPGTLTVDGTLAAGIADVAPKIDARREPDPPAATRQVPRIFSLPDIEPLAGLRVGPALVHFTEDLRRLLSPDAAGGEASPTGRLGLFGKETKHDGTIDPQPIPARLATLFELSVQVPATLHETTRSLAAGSRAVIEVLGTSEAQRKPLDALFPLGVANPVLGRATLHLAIRQPGGVGYKLIDWSAGLKVARATTNRERKPGEDLKAFASLSDDKFLAEATDVAGFLELLRRAAIVNAGGTYMLFEHLADDLYQHLGSAGARLSVLLVYSADQNAALPGKAVNAAVLDQPLGAGKRLVAMATDSCQGISDRLYESAAVREPGAELFRFWRKAPRDNDDTIGKPTDEEKREYLERLFDMLEFGVVGAGVPLATDRSLPLASEAVSKSAKGNADEQPFNASQISDLAVPPDADEWLKYDLLVPLWRWAPVGKNQQPGDMPNPYNALLQSAYRIDYGWRDIFGNRLEQTDSFVHQPRYSDPLDPPAAWPAVASRFCFGTAPGTIELHLIDTSADAGLDPVERERALWRAIHQLEGPHVGARIASRFGTLKPPPDLVTPEKFALALAKALRKFLKPGQSPATWAFDVTPQTAAPHAPLDLTLTIERAAAHCVPGCPADIRFAQSPIPLVARVPVVGDETSPARRLASEFSGAFLGHMLARGTADDGSSQWWAVDRRILCLKAKMPLEVHAQPPLALASVAARDVDLTVFERADAGGGWTALTRTIDVPEIDSDASFADFLDKLERFVGPAMAGSTALQSDSFNRVMRAKHRMLGPRDEASGLFREVRNVEAKSDELGPLAAPARRVLRQACGNDFRAFYDVAAVLVRPLEFLPNVPEQWFGTGEAAHKLHGRFVLGANDRHLRLSTFGIPLSGRTTAVAAAVHAPLDPTKSIGLQDRLEFEITHVEREVDVQEGGADTMPAASSWLHLVAPEGTGNGLPVVQLTEGAQAIPAPVRRLPAPPSLSEPQPEEAAAPVSGAGYDAQIARICSWQYRLKLAGLMGASGRTGDEACCRLVYNVDPGASRIDTQTAAQPLFPTLGHALAKYKEEADGLWGVLNEPEDPLFPAACREFAAVAEGIADAIEAAPAKFFNGLPPAEDRFIIERVDERRVRFRFENHIPDPVGPGASPFKQLAKGRRCIIGKGNSSWKPLDQGPQEFASAGDDLVVGIDGMRVQNRRSVWAAASIRRNPTLHWRFVYRTSEVYLQQPVVPFLENRDTIELGPRGGETLASRLAAALQPILARPPTVVDEAALTFPLQLSLGVEPRRLARLFVGHTLPAPAPKVQIVCQARAEGELEVAERLAAAFLAKLAGESLGPHDDVRLILSVLLLTEDRQPLLDIRRIAISIQDLLPLEREEAEALN